jgi:bacterioferritin-associated ferredoxin
VGARHKRAALIHSGPLSSRIVMDPLSPAVEGLECDGVSVSPNTRDGYVCACLKVTHADLLAALACHEVRTVKDLCRYTGAGDGCMACHPRLRCYVEVAADAGSPVDEGRSL